MKNKVFMASLGLVVLFALAFAACKNEPDATTKFEGDWSGTVDNAPYILRIRGTSVTYLDDGINDGTGTIEYTDTTITFNKGAASASYPYSLNGGILTLTGGVPFGGTWTRL